MKNILTDTWTSLFLVLFSCLFFCSFASHKSKSNVDSKDSNKVYVKNMYLKIINLQKKLRYLPIAMYLQRN